MQIMEMEIIQMGWELAAPKKETWLRNRG